MRSLSARLSRVILVVVLAAAALYAAVSLAPAALDIEDLAGVSLWPSPLRPLMDRFSPYPTAGWVGPFDPPLRPLTAADTHYLVADAACTTTAIATDTDCWSHTSGGAGGAGVPGQNNAVVVDANSGGGTFTVDADWSIASLDMTGSTATLSLGSATTTVYGNWTARTVTVSTSTVVFAANGSLNVLVGTGNKFYNLTVNAGVTVTNVTATSGNIYVAVENLLTINGTVLGGSPNDPQKLFMVASALADPLVLGANADIDSIGYFIYRYRGACGGSQNVTPGLYQHLAVQGGNSACAVTFNQQGDISTPSCGVFNECAIIVHSEATGTPAANYVYNTNDYDITAGGTFWIGDGGTTGATLNAGSSAITAYGVSTTGTNVIANFQTATITARPSSTETNLCFYGSSGETANLNSSTFNCYGQFRVTADMTLNAGSATVNVLRESGAASEVGFDQIGARSPGEVVILNTGIIVFDTSVWTIDSLWQNNNSSERAAWDAGTATLTFRQTGINTGYTWGGTILGEAEFYNVIIDTATSTTQWTFDNDRGLWVGNSLTFRGTTVVTTNNADITVPTLSIESGTLTMGTGDLLGVNRLDVDGTLSMDSITVANIDLSLDQSATMEITAWTAYDLTAATFDVRWTLGTISSASATLAVTVGELTHTVRTDYTLARDGTNVREERVGESETVMTFRLAGGWGSPDAMAITAVDAPPGGGGGSLPSREFPLWAWVLLLGAVYVVYASTRRRRRK